MNLIRRGKVKEVYDLGDRLLFKFTDNISVFDKIIPTRIPNKGKSLCLTSEFWFEKLRDMKIDNHFLELRSDTEMVVRKFNIISNPKTSDKNYLIPLEFIVRHYVAGSLYRKIKSGKIDAKSLGIKGEYGEKLPEPYFEITTKFEEYDRKVDFREAMDIGGLTKDDIEEIREIILKIDEEMEREVSRRNLIHVDGKKEFAMDSERNMVVVDTFGTLDEDRWWDREKYEQGEIVELSKEFVRKYYIDIGYYDELTRARECGDKEPDIPPLPDDMVKRTEKLYIEMYERITGRRWR